MILADEAVSDTFVKDNSPVAMTDKEIKEMVKGLKAYKKKVTASKEASRKFLVELGIVDKKGNIQEPYKPLCTQ